MPSAPAAKAVEYQRIKFNATMGVGSPYVGKGPEVDKAWRALSYDSESKFIVHGKTISLTVGSWRPGDYTTRIEDNRHAYEFFKSKTPQNRS